MYDSLRESEKKTTLLNLAPNVIEAVVTEKEIGYLRGEGNSVKIFNKKGKEAWNWIKRKCITYNSIYKKRVHVAFINGAVPQHIPSSAYVVCLKQ